MAANSLTEVIPQLLAQGMVALREMSIMPRLVNLDYSADARQKGDTIDIPIPSAIEVQDVAPAATPPATEGVKPTKVSIKLDKWKEAPFYLDDKEILQVLAGTIPMQASEAIRALANQVDKDLINQAVLSFYGYTGTAGTTPFGTADDISDMINVRKILNKLLAPPDNRRLVLDPDAEASALGQRAFQDASWRGDNSGIINGQLQRKMGFDIFSDQNISSFGGGTLSDGTGKACKVDHAGDGGFLPVGSTDCAVDSSTLTGTVEPGDRFTVAGDDTVYIITAKKTAGSNAIASMEFAPASKVAWANNADITFVAAFSPSLGFHRDALALAIRPLEDTVSDGLGSIIQSATDPISGLSLRLEVKREHKRIRYSYDVLYGVGCPRPEFGCILAG